VHELRIDEFMLIQDCDSSWPHAFSKLATGVKAALGSLIVTVEHIGSTAVPGLAAKPIIDLDVVLASPVDLPEAIRRLSARSSDRSPCNTRTIETRTLKPNRRLLNRSSSNPATVIPVSLVFCQSIGLSTLRRRSARKLIRTRRGDGQFQSPYRRTLCRFTKLCLTSACFYAD